MEQVIEYPEHAPDMTYTAYEHPVFDCDHHFYETVDSFTRYLPPELKGVIRYVEVDGRTKIAVGGRISEYIPNPTFEVAAAPGSGMAYFGGHNPEGKTFREIVTPMKAVPEWTDRDARIALLDRMHVDRIVNYPTLASLLEVSFMDQPLVIQKLIHGFNRWIDDEWGFTYLDRIHTTPIINLGTCQGAIDELEWVLERGARTVLIRPAPVASHGRSRSPFLPEFDPFWARVSDADIPVIFHSSDSGYQDYTNDWLGDTGEFLPFKTDTFRLMIGSSRPTMDTVFSALSHGMLSRFPKVRIAFVEQGSSWLPRVVDDIAATYKKAPQEFSEHPLDVLQRQVWVAPFWEDPIQPVIDILGVEHVLFSSDWPHPEGLADPVGYTRWCAAEGISADETRKIMGENMMKLLGV